VRVRPTLVIALEQVVGVDARPPLEVCARVVQGLVEYKLSIGQLYRLAHSEGEDVC